MENLIRLPSSGKPVRHFFFSRGELGQLLSLYSSRVRTGEWRDYALDKLDDAAVFSIFRHSHETPLFTVSKVQKKGQRRPSFTVHAGPKRLKSAQSLLEALEVFDKLPRLVKG